jgi:hypothetical protein
MELTSEGDSLWQQTIAYDTINASYNYAYNSKITPDGGLIITGKVNSVLNSPYQQMWLVKTDSMGCDGTEYTCDVSYLEEVSEKENNLLLYPNPVRDVLYVSLNNSELNNNVQITNNKEIDFVKLKVISGSPTNDVLNKQQFQELPIDQKLKYNVAHPKQKLWTEKEEQEMRELSRKLAYAFPFEVIKGKVNIFSIDPALAMQVESRKLQVKSETKSEPRYSGLQDYQDVVIYDIFGRVAKQLVMNNEQLEINVSDLQSGVYFVKVGDSVAKFVKE